MLDAIRVMQPAWQAIKGLPVDQANAALTSLIRGVVPTVGGPVTPALMQAVKNFEGFAPRAQWDYKQYSSGYGTRAAPGEQIDQMTAEARLTAELSHAQSIVDQVNPNLPPGVRAALTSLTFNAGGDWTKAGLGEKIKAGDYAGARALFMDYNKAGGAVNAGLAQRRAAEAQWFETEGPVPKIGGDALQPGQSAMNHPNPFVLKLFESTVTEMKGMQAKNADHMAEGLIKQADAGDPVDPESLKLFVATAIGGGKEELLQKVLPVLQSYDLKMALAPNASTAAALQSEITAWKNSGIDPTKWTMLDNLQKQIARDTQLWEKDPLTAGVHSGDIKPLGALDTTKPENFGGEMAARAPKIAALRAGPHAVGPTSALSESEAQAVKTALTQGDPQVAAKLLGAMQQTLKPDDFRATLATGPMKDALDGMIRSYDPVRLNAAMGVLDELWRKDPVGFSRQFDNETRRLQAWQSWQDSATPAEIAERFKRADDPQFIKAREVLGEEADKENKKMSPNDVAGAIWATDHPILSHVPFVGPSAPTDPLQAGAMKAEFDGLRKELRQMGVDPDQATKQASERLKTIYGASDVNSGQMMRRPPERYYPQVDGSHGWMTAPLEADIAKAVGKPKISAHPGDLGPHFSDNWSYGLVADPQTEADISAGRLPSYQVFVTDAATGRINQPRDPAGNLMRYRWDATAMQEASRKRFTIRRTDTQQAEEMQRMFPDKLDLP
jgi:GH24 family phage-related lysozyme (muramidase)